MEIYHMFTGKDGYSTMEKWDMSKVPTPTETMEAKEIFFRVLPPGYKIGFHDSGQRKWVVYLSGRIKTIFADGTSHIMLPGDVRLNEDIPGKGHKTEVVGDEPSVTMVIHLKD
jgi:hypothetical protein